jgi:PAS domain S-box-containing protein
MAFANASPGMAVISPTGDVIEANRSLADLVHRPLDRLQSEGWSAFIHPDDYQLVAAQVGQLGAEGIWSFQQSVRCVRSRGEVVWCLLGVSLATDEAGENPYLFAQFQDINDLVHTEQRLRVSEEHYRNLFGHSPVAVLEQDFTAVGAWLDELRQAGVDDLRDHLRLRPDLVEDGVELIRVGNVNEATIELLEARGRAGRLDGLPREMLTEQMIEVIVDQFVAVWEGRDRAEASAVSATMQGRRLDLVVHWVAPVVDARLDLSQVVVALADVTEYRRTQEALRRIEERLRTVVGAAPIILFAVDRYGIFTLAEGQGLSALGLRSGEAVGRSVFEMFRDSSQFVAAVRRSLSGEGFATSVEITGLDFDTRFTPIWDGSRVEGAVGVAYDITERKRAQERLEELIRSKDEFVASVSHELRTPLTAVVGFAQELQASLEEYGPEERALLVSLIADQSLEVADLVEDLLVAARVDLDRVAVAADTVNVVDEIRSVLAAWQPAEAERVGIDGLDVMVHADAIRLRQIIRNLLSNAKRYGGEHIDVVVGEIEGFVSVMVQDDGPGVPPRDRERIFEPYHRAHRLDGQPASVGLGLTVSRHLARLMGGDLSYRYQDDRSIFELQLMPALTPQISVGSSADVLPSLDASAAPGAEPD